jgi:hypothetical protein
MVRPIDRATERESELKMKKGLECLKAVSGVDRKSQMITLKIKLLSKYFLNLINQKTK